MVDAVQDRADVPDDQCIAFFWEDCCSSNEAQEPVMTAASAIGPHSLFLLITPELVLSVEGRAGTCRINPAADAMHTHFPAQKFNFSTVRQPFYMHLYSQTSLFQDHQLEFSNTQHRPSASKAR